MTVSEHVFMNECGLPLNDVPWLETHHTSKLPERQRMVRDMQIKPTSLVVDAGCGPGLWTPLLAQALGPQGRIIGVDISAESLVSAQQRSHRAWYRHMVQYKCAPLKQLPLPPGAASVIFSANVCQYLPDPVETFAAMGRYLAPHGRLIIKDIDFGTMRFSHIDEELFTRVKQGRQQWERVRHNQGYTFEDSWIGSKLAAYLRQAGYEEVEERQYRIVRAYPLTPQYRFYVQGIAEWFVSENNPLQTSDDKATWLRHFFDQTHAIFDQANFTCEESEFVVSGVWRQPRTATLRRVHSPERILYESNESNQPPPP